MTLVDYIQTRISSLQDQYPHGIWKEETQEQRLSRIDELHNLLDVLAGQALGMGG